MHERLRFEKELQDLGLKLSSVSYSIQREYEKYIPGEMSRVYHKLPPHERARIDEEIDRKFKEQTGISRKLKLNDVKDRPLIQKWLLIRDEVMSKRLADPKSPIPITGTVGGAEIMKLGVIYKADPYLSLRSAPQANSSIVTKLDFNTRVFIHKELPGDWYFVVTEKGQAGYVPKWTVKVNPPDPLARLHKIKSGESAIGIAEQYYKKDAQSWGSDLRFYINVLVYANDGDGNNTKGIYREKGVDWKDAKTREGYFIWIPTVEYAIQLKGKVKSGSITYDAWQTVKNIAYKVWNFIKFGAAFIAGLLHGIGESLWDILVGIKDLAEMLWSVIKSIFSGNIISDAEDLYNTLVNLDYRQIAENWIKDFGNKWNHENSLKRGHFRGWVIGYAIAEIVLTFISFGTLTGIKWTAKMAKLAKIVKNTKLVRRITSGLDSMKGKVKSLLDKIKKSPKQLGKALSRTEALEFLRQLERKYGDYVLKGLGLSSSEGRDAILRVLPANPTTDQLETFMRKSQQLLSEEGKTQVGKILGWSLDEVRDKGFKGKVLENMIQHFGQNVIDDLNRLRPNFPVVDAISRRSGHVISIARGTPEYLWDQIQVLFNVKITQSGIQSANLAKFNNMLSLLRSSRYGITGLSDFLSRARLIVPNHSVLPLKAMISARVRDPAVRGQMLNAVISEL